MGSFGRILDYLFAFYFIMCIPIATIMDSQMFMPSWIYPEWAKAMSSWYGTTFKDTFIGAAPVWAQSIFVAENTIQLPFFFVGAYAFIKGGCTWIRTPLLLYACNTMSMLLPIFAHVLLHDYSKDPKSGPAGPRNMEERLILASVYSTFLLFPFAMFLRMFLDEEYNGKAKTLKTE